MAIVVTEILDINPLLGLKPPNFSEPGNVSVFIWNMKMGKYEYNLVDILESIRLNFPVIQGLGLDLSKGPTANLSPFPFPSKTVASVVLREVTDRHRSSAHTNIIVFVRTN